MEAISKTISIMGAAGAPGFLPDRNPMTCTDSRWQELSKWAESGELLRQNSPRRSGKLAWLAPDSISGEAMALPIWLDGDLDGFTMRGAVVFELDLGRSLQVERESALRSWGGPLGLALANSMRSNPDFKREILASEGGERSDRISAKEHVVGAESGLRAVMERVHLVATSDMPVLILGDTGTGKEVVARAIHTRSTRSRAPFLRVNCGAIPPELIDSQLFGHERGSFTGASDQRKGWFERAHGGTLFLDEIGELPLAAQVRLLRVLQERQIERVGGQDTLHVDVRIVAATHRDLATMVHQRTFREDLWYRINVFPILLPRLCERTEDIPELTRHFARKASLNFGIPYVEPSISDIDRLIDYHWPGNIRELQAVIDRAVILGRGAKLDITTALGIGFGQRYQPAPESDEPTFYEVIPESSSPLVTQEPSQATTGDNARIESLNESMKKHIERALLASRGQIEGKRGAAETLRINPHTLRAKMRKLGIRWSDFRKD
jgi:transcriptional regulator with GAF, ATPase, and Fis domain